MNLTNAQKEMLFRFHIRAALIKDVAEVLKTTKPEAYEIYKDNIIPIIKEFRAKGYTQKIKIEFDADDVQADNEPEPVAMPKKPEAEIAPPVSEEEEKRKAQVREILQKRREEMMSRREKHLDEGDAKSGVRRTPPSDRKTKDAEKVESQIDAPVIPVKPANEISIPEDTMKAIIAGKRPVVIENGEHAKAVAEFLLGREFTNEVIKDVPEKLANLSIADKSIITDIDAPYILVKPIKADNKISVKIRNVE